MIHSLLTSVLFVHLAASGYAGTPPAQVPPVQAKRNITKSLRAVIGQQLRIDNQYGNVEVKAWPKNEVLINITLTTSAKTKPEAVRLLKRVSIQSSRTPDAISYHTVISPSIDPVQKDTTAWGDQLRTIYVVFVPADQPLRIKNEFGDIKLTGCSGHITVNASFGNVDADNVAFDSLNLEQGNISIGSLGGGTITAKGFESATIGSITGDIQCFFEAGKTLNLSLPNGRYNLQLNSKDVVDVNLQCARGLSANLSLDATLSYVLNQSNLRLQHDASGEPILVEGHKAPAPMDKPSSVQMDKKIKLHPPIYLVGRKTIHYYTVGVAGGATIKIKTAFGKVTFK